MNQKKKFFCIRGYMKSGTNWVCRLLKSHPDIDCVGEFHWESFFHALQNNVANIAPARRQRLNDAVRPELESMIKRCLTSLSDKEARWIGDRTPTTIAPVIMSDAPHIIVVRDFRDVIVSRMFHLYNHPRVTGIFDRYPEMRLRLEKYQHDPWYFREHADELLSNEELMRDSARDWSTHLRHDRETVQAHPKLAVKTIRYEELHADFERLAASLFEFLGLPSALPPIPESLRPGHATEDPTGLNRKGEVGDWKNYITDQSRQWILEEAGEELIRQGYISSADW